MSGLTAPLTATCVAIPPSRRRPKKTWPILKKSAGGRTRPAEPGRGACADGADPANDPGRQGAPAAGGDTRLQGRAVRLRGAEPDLWGLAHDHAGEPAGGQPQERAEQDQEDAAGVRRAPAAR